MAMPRRIQVEFSQAFEHGLFMVGEVEPSRDFDKSTREQLVQEVDEESGLPVWTVDVIDADPSATKATRSLSIKILAKVQPVPPETPDGAGPFRPVVLDGLVVAPWVDSRTCTGPEKGRPHRCRAKQGWSYRASGFADPKQSTGSSSGAGKGSRPAAA